MQLDRDGARFVVADDGPGFDTSIFDRPVMPEDLNRIGGRGLLLIRTFMDQVSFQPDRQPDLHARNSAPACQGCTRGVASTVSLRTPLPARDSALA